MSYLIDRSRKSSSSNITTPKVEKERDRKYFEFFLFVVLLRL